MQLLVSVRNASEALVAARSGADIIDVKEPTLGSLGFAGWGIINSVVDAVGKDVTVSAALGECHEWPDDSTNSIDGELAADGLTFVKLGLAQLAGPSSSHHDWINSWNAAKHRAVSCFPGTAPKLNWVAVAYADATAAKAPSVQQVLIAAISERCSVLLIDTYVKDGKSSLSWLTEAELIQLRSAAHEGGLRFALAGQLTPNDLPSVARIRPDIFAVRGAVCEHDRRSTIEASKVAELKAMLQTFGKSIQC